MAKKLNTQPVNYWLFTVYHRDHGTFDVKVYSYEASNKTEARRHAQTWGKILACNTIHQHTQ